MSPKPLKVLLQLSIWHLTRVLLLYSLFNNLASLEFLDMPCGGLLGSNCSGISSDTGKIVPCRVGKPSSIRTRCFANSNIPTLVFASWLWCVPDRRWVIFRRKARLWICCRHRVLLNLLTSFKSYTLEKNSWRYWDGVFWDRLPPFFETLVHFLYRTVCMCWVVYVRHVILLRS